MKEFVMYTPQELNEGNIRNIVFEMVAVCLAHGNRIIIEQEVEHGEKYVMVDFAPTDNSNSECEYDGEHVCWISSVDHDDEGKYYSNHTTYAEAVEEVVRILGEGFTEVYTEWY